MKSKYIAILKQAKIFSMQKKNQINKGKKVQHLSNIFTNS